MSGLTPQQRATKKELPESFLIATLTGSARKPPAPRSPGASTPWATSVREHVALERISEALGKGGEGVAIEFRHLSPAKTAIGVHEADHSVVAQERGRHVGAAPGERGECPAIPAGVFHQHRQATTEGLRLVQSGAELETPRAQPREQVLGPL